MKNFQKIFKYLIILLILWAVLLIGIVIFNRISNKNPFDESFKSSNNYFAIYTSNYDNDTEQEHYVATYYCIFNKKDKCTSCFVKIENCPERIYNANIDFGYINPIKKDNYVLFEFTNFRGRTYDEITKSFNNSEITETWKK